MEEYVYIDGKKYRRGYTTGSCATAASKAATYMLLTKKKIKTINIDTPKGIPLTLDVQNISLNNDYVECSIKKDGGDDIDATHTLSLIHILDSSISEEGKEQIDKITNYLKDFDIDKIYTTTSSRTKDTVKKLSELKSIEIIEKESLKEISFGDFEGLTFDEIKDKYPKEFQDMIEKGYEYKYPNGESLIDSYNRVCIELDNIISNNDDRTILICSHGGTIRNIITYLISNSYKYHWNFKIDNGSVTILEVQDGFTVITAMNNTSFI